MAAKHIILDFSHVYLDENIPKNDKLHWLDCSDINECDLYCSKQAEEQIWNKIEPYGINGIHFLDSGNYHYVTGIITDHIRQDFVLVLFDHHTDMQKPMIEHMTSCGDWAAKALDTNERLKQLILIGPHESDIAQIECKNKDKLITFSAEELRKEYEQNAIGDNNKISKIRKDLPFYISIDKDVLDEKYSETNWSQGRMSLTMLERLLTHFLENEKIIGIDICGECQQGIPLPEYFEAEEINSETNRELFEFLTNYIKIKNKESVQNPYVVLQDDIMLKKLEVSREHANQGEYKDADSVIEDIRAKYGLGHEGKESEL
ncbi:arginase family protein [Agathobacter sp.]